MSLWNVTRPLSEDYLYLKLIDFPRLVSKAREFNWPSRGSYFPLIGIDLVALTQIKGICQQSHLYGFIETANSINP